MLFFFGIDTLIICAAIFASYLLRFDGKIPSEYIVSMPYAIGLIWMVNYGVFYITKLYRRVWQYASMGELLAIIKSSTIALLFSLLFHLLVAVWGIFPHIPRSIFLLSWMGIIIGIGGSRFGWRLYRDRDKKVQAHHKKTLIVGAGNAGMLVARELRSSDNSSLYPVAFIDDDPGKQGMKIFGLPVVGSRDDIHKIVEKHKINTIVIAMPSAPKEKVARIIEVCKQTSAALKLLPRVSDVIDGRVSVNMIRDVKVEDLLGRDPVKVDLEGIANYVTDQTVLITGAGGSIGSEIVRQIAGFSPARLLLLGHGENSIYAIENEIKRKYPYLCYETIIADIQDRKRIEDVFRTYRPAVVFHAAAHKHVPLMEKNPTEAVKNNVLGTRNIAECAHLYAAQRFVLVSTDKAVNPTNVMGATKRIAEMIVQSLDRVSDTQFVAVRFGNVLGSRGSVIPLFKQQIREGGPVTVTHPEMIRYFMTIPEAVQLVIQAGALAKGGEVFILDMGEPVKIDQLARDLVRLSGLEPDKDIKIRYSGIRPGEKLYEELLTAEEGTAATKHDRIFIGKPCDFSKEDFSFMLRRLEQVVLVKDKVVSADEVKTLLQQLVPTYKRFDSSQIVTSPEQEVAYKEIKKAKAEVAVATVLYE